MWFRYVLSFKQLALKSSITLKSARHRVRASGSALPPLPCSIATCFSLFCHFALPPPIPPASDSLPPLGIIAGGIGVGGPPFSLTAPPASTPSTPSSTPSSTHF